jgi:beta-1,4-mannosyltransferase
MRVTIVVLGDLGRSPRMQYHAEALAAHHVNVDVVACAGSALPAEVRAHPHITCHMLPPPRERALPRALSLVVAGLRAAGQTARSLWMLLAVVRKPDVILVQNPPAIPTLLVALAAARLRRARLVLDWHNLAWKVLALAIGQRHPVVGLARWYEGALGRQADAHICVSDALRADLSRRWRIAPITVLRDRPAERFAPLPPLMRREVRRRLLERLNLALGEPAIVVSPTSWTRDEDFDLLLEAVRRVEALVADLPFPDVLVLVTGRGAGRGRFERQAALLSGRRLHVRTLWLEADDYPRVLAAADLGLCLHRSASGLDLPMKIADMQGAGLPVCALDYGPCLDEVLRHGDTGLRFGDAGALARQFVELLAAFPAATPQLDRLRANLERARGMTWRAGWEADARAVLLANE